MHSSSKDFLLERKRIGSEGDIEPARYEIEVLRKDGSIVPIEVLSSIIDYEGKPTTLAFARDITERKWMEEELEQYSDHLAELVAKRTVELSVSEERLRSFISSAPDAFSL